MTNYQKRISGPLLDRIDIHSEVPRVDYEKLSGDRVGEFSACIRERVQAARNVQQADSRIPNYKTRGDILLCMTQLNLSARAYHRTRSVKLARTIANLAGNDEI